MGPTQHYSEHSDVDQPRRLEDIRRRRSALREVGRVHELNNKRSFDSDVGPSTKISTKSSDADTSHDWELMKENAAPLARGRDAVRLSKALGAPKNSLSSQMPVALERKKATFEKLISQSEKKCVEGGKDEDADPLVTWLSYMKWMQEEYSPSDTRESFLLLERCTRAFLRVVKYRNDVRFIRVCVTYADKTDCAASVFKLLNQNKVGTKTSLFWIAWAWVAEKAKDFNFAEKVFMKGKSVHAEPRSLLEQRHKQFHRRMARHFLNRAEEQNGVDGQSDTPDYEDRGVALSYLSKQDENVNYRGKFHRAVDIGENGQFVRSGLGRNNFKRQGTSFRQDGSVNAHVGGRMTNGVQTGDGFRIFMDENSTVPDFDFESCSRNEISRQLNTEADRKKENVEKADKWNIRGGVIGSEEGCLSHDRSRISKEPSEVSFSVFVDEENTRIQQDDEPKKSGDVRKARSLRQIRDGGAADKLVKDPLRYMKNPEKVSKDKANELAEKKQKSFQKTQVLPAKSKSTTAKTRGKTVTKSRHFEDFCFEEKRALAKYFKIDSSRNFSIFEKHELSPVPRSNDSVDARDMSIESINEAQVGNKSNDIYAESEEKNPRRVLFTDNKQVSNYSNKSLNESNASSTINEADAVGGTLVKEEETMHTKFASLELSTMFHSPSQEEDINVSVTTSKPLFSIYTNIKETEVVTSSTVEFDLPVNKRTKKRVNFADENINSEGCFLKRPALQSTPEAMDDSKRVNCCSKNGQYHIFQDDENLNRSLSPTKGGSLFDIFEDDSKSNEDCSSDINLRKIITSSEKSGKVTSEPISIFEDAGSCSSDKIGFGIFCDDDENCLEGGNIGKHEGLQKNVKTISQRKCHQNVNENEDAPKFSVFEDGVNCSPDDAIAKLSEKNNGFGIFCDEVEVKSDSAKTENFVDKKRDTKKILVTEDDCIQDAKSFTLEKENNESFCNMKVNDENDHVNRNKRNLNQVFTREANFTRSKSTSCENDTASFSVFEDVVSCFQAESVTNGMSVNDLRQKKKVLKQIHCPTRRKSQASGDQCDSNSLVDSEFLAYEGDDFKVSNDNDKDTKGGDLAKEMKQKESNHKSFDIKNNKDCYMSSCELGSSDISRIVKTNSSLIDDGFVSVPALKISHLSEKQESIIYDDVHSAHVLSSLQVLMDEVSSGLGITEGVSDETIEWCTGEHGPIGDRRSIILPKTLFSKRAMVGTQLMLDGLKMACVRELGSGSNATVLLCRKDMSAPDPREIAVKVQSPTGCLALEYTILRDLDLRMKRAGKNTNFLPKPFSFHAYSNGSLLGMTAGSQNGINLLDIVNIHKTCGGSHGVPELLVIHYTSRMLQHLIELHRVGQVLHCDIKPDNWVLTSGEYKEQEINGAELMLVDFGRAIDLKTIENDSLDIKFCGDAAGEDMACVSMQEGESWCYDIDTYGLCASAHVLLFGAHMEVFKDPEGSWRTKKTIRRYWKAKLWNALFIDLLNTKNEDNSQAHIDKMSRTLTLFTSHLNQPNKSREVAALLRHQSGWLSQNK